MHENRETSGGFLSQSGPVREGDSDKPDRHAAEESHSAVVPMKPPNKEVQALAEVVEEGR
jgi:hypothetical protein